MTCIILIKTERHGTEKIESKNMVNIIPKIDSRSYWYMNVYMYIFIYQWKKAEKRAKGKPTQTAFLCPPPKKNKVNYVFHVKSYTVQP